MEIINILNKKVSYQDHFWTETKERTLNDVLNEIKGNKHRAKTNYLRTFYNKGDMDNYGCQKRKLPGVMFCGSFASTRRKESLKTYNCLVVLDIDKLDTNELIRVKHALFDDKYVFSFWESPSKNGVKGLVFLDYKFNIKEYGEDHSHKIAFKQLVTYFQETHKIELDISGSDITRLCFLSWDPDLIIKNNVYPFEIEYDMTFKVKDSATPKTKKQINPNSRDILYNPNGKNNQFNRTTMGIIIKYLKNNKLSITNTYEEWYKVALAIANSFTYEVGEKYFLELSKLDIDKYNEIECKNMLIDCYKYSRGEIKFSSIIHFASEKGFIYNKQ